MIRPDVDTFPSALNVLRQQSRPGATAAALGGRQRQSAPKTLPSTPQPEIGAPRIRSVDEVPLLRDCGQAELSYIESPVLAEGAVTMWTGDAGSGKSTLGLYFAGEAIKQKRPVLILDRENPLAIIRERLARLHIEDGPELHYWGGWLSEEAPQPAAGIILEWVTRCEPKPLIVVDSAAAFHGGNENDAGETRAFVHQCRKLADLGAAALLLHHDGKADSAKDYRGSSDFKAAVDQAFHITNSGALGGRLETIRLRCYKSRFGFAGELIYHYRDGQFIRDDSPFAPQRTVTQQLTELLRDNPGIKAAEFERLAATKGLGRNRARTFLDDGTTDGFVRREKGTNNVIRHYLKPEAETDVF